MLDFVSNYHDVRQRLGLGVRPAIIMRAPVGAQPKPVRLRSYPEPIGPMQPFAASDERRFGPRRIILAVAQVTGVTVDEIVSDARPQRISRARFLCYYMLRQHTSMSYPGIAAHSFPGRTFDHSTLIHGVKRIESALKSDKRTRDQVEAVLAILNGEGPEIGRELSTIDVPDWIPVEAVDAFMTCELERGRRRATKWAYDRFRKRDVVRVRTTKPRPWFDSRNIIRRFDGRRAAVLEVLGKGPTTCEQIAASIGSSKRTVYREIQALRDKGVTIYSASSRGYFIGAAQ